MRNRRAAVPSGLLESETVSPTCRPSEVASCREIRIVGSCSVCAATSDVAHQAIDANNARVSTTIRSLRRRTFELSLSSQLSDHVGAQRSHMKLFGQREIDWQNRGHFFAIAAQ